jgi:hypothetical protein
MRKPCSDCGGLPRHDPKCVRIQPDHLSNNTTTVKGSKKMPMKVTPLVRKFIDLDVGVQEDLIKWSEWDDAEWMEEFVVGIKEGDYDEHLGKALRAINVRMAEVITGAITSTPDEAAAKVGRVEGMKYAAKIVAALGLKQENPKTGKKYRQEVTLHNYVDIISEHNAAYLQWCKDNGVDAPPHELVEVESPVKKKVRKVVKKEAPVAVETIKRVKKKVPATVPAEKPVKRVAKKSPEKKVVARLIMVKNLQVGDVLDDEVSTITEIKPFGTEKFTVKHQDGSFRKLGTDKVRVRKEV